MREVTHRRCAYCDVLYQNANTSSQPYKCPTCLAATLANAIATPVGCEVGTHEKTVVLRFPGHLGTFYLTPSIAKMLAGKLEDAAESIEPREVFTSRPQSVDGEPGG